MKPQKPTTDHAKGLARWGWIKRYLSPAMKYAGITSEDFDKLFLGDDQFLRNPQDVRSIFPQPQISISGTIYTPIGSPPPESNTNDGWWYLEWQWTPDAIEFDADATPDIIYCWGGNYTFVTLPRYDFKSSETESDGIVVNSASPDSGWTRILVATRTNGLIESYGSPAMIEVNLSGFNTVTACII